MEREADMKQWLMLVLAVAGLLIAVACNIPAQCDASQLGAPGNLAPAAREIVACPENAEDGGVPAAP